MKSSPHSPHHSFGLLLLTVFSLFVATSPVLQAGGGNKDSKFVPFKGAMSIIDPTQMPVFDEEGNFIGIQDEATGIGTHVGGFEAIIIFQPLPPNFVVFDGIIMMIAANGDLIQLEFKGASVGAPVNDVFPIAFTADIVGGTGRFENATGSIDLDGFILPSDDDTAFGPTFFSFDGVISSVGSSRVK
jgi:hypothetical protein